MALNEKQQRALTNAAVAVGLTAVIGLIVVAILPVEGHVVTEPTPSSSPSPIVACAPSWTSVDSPDPEDGGSLLLGVVAVAPDDAWAVGGAGDPQAPTSTLAIRWNGAEWDVVPTPNTGSVANSFEAVDALSPDAAWAVGRASNGVGDVPIVAQWNGAAWANMTLPTEVSEGALTGVAAISTDDVWVVGYAGDTELGEERAIALHWNGIVWKAAPVQPAIGGGRTGLVAIASTASNDLWAVGYQHNRPVILRYDGHVWARIPSDVPGAVTGVTALAPDDAWVVGERVQHWDGKTWSELGTVRASGMLRGIAAVSPNDVWAVGSRAAGEDAVLKPFVQRWDGERWRRLNGDGIAGAVSLAGVSALPDGTLLAVGYRDGKSGRSTFTVRGTTCLDA